MADWLVESVRIMPVPWQVFFLSMLPVTELRAAIPVGIAQGAQPLPVFLFAVTGNWVPVVPLLLLLGPVSRLFARVPLFESVLEKLFSRTHSKSAKVERYGTLGLLLFVGIPAPGTGVWTGSLLAFLLGISFWRALPSIFGGAVLAGVLVTLASVGVFKLITTGPVLAAVLLTVALLLWLFYRRH